MLPQFNLHTISGVGVPTASQMMVKDPPSSTSILATGGKLMDGGAKNINHFIPTCPKNLQKVKNIH
jgi:hypothetical protein